ncbi:MAG: TlpA disulfide reductase family protein, partial [Bacteroidota bacterium]
TEPTYYDLVNGNQKFKLFIKPGDKINISLNGSNPLASLSFSGDGVAENNYLKNKSMAGGSRLNKQQNYALGEAEFQKVMNEHLQAAKSVWEDYLKDNKGMHPSFVATEEADLLYEWADEYYNYPRYHKFYAQKPDFQASPEFMKYLDQVNFNDEAIVGSTNYQKFLIHYLYEEGVKLMEKDPELKSKTNGRTLANLRAVNEQFTAQKVKDFLTFSIFQDHLKYQSVNDLGELMKAFNENNTNAIYKEIVNKEYNRWIPLNRGQPAPNFKYKDINGKEFALSDFKGKYVYIDIWATWCGPCKKEIPHLESLQKAYKNYPNLVFASISIDKNIDAWEKMVKDQSMKGLQLIGENAGQSKICRDYQVSGIPRFILVDDQGKIIDARAPRPSSKEIKTILEELVS